MVRLCELVRCPEKHAGAITVAGWIKTARASKTIGFIELTDGSCFKTVFPFASSTSETMYGSMR